MMKKMLAVLAALLVLLGVSAALAEAGEERTCGSYRYVVLTDGMAEITGYSGSDKKLTVPDQLDGYPVVSIGSRAFSGKHMLTGVTLPEGLTTLGKGAFKGCGALTSVTLPHGLTTLGDEVFSDCDELTSIVLPDTVTEIGQSAFSHCTNLRSLVIPEGVTRIMDFTFYGCYKLTDVSLPDSLRRIGGKAFSNCEMLKSLVLPEGVYSIGEYAFWQCLELESVYVPAGVMYMGSRPFAYCPLLTVYCVEGSFMEAQAEKDKLNYVCVPPEEQELRRLTRQPNADGSVSVTGYTGSRTEITIPAQLDMCAVTAVAPAGFAGQTGLTTIVISDGVTAIGEYAFLGCPTLKTLVIPASVTEIGTGVGLLSPALTLTVSEGSTGHEYAVANGLNFVLAE